jgi:hypothetical protein
MDVARNTRAHPLPGVGLCAACANARRVTTPRGSSFVLCQRSVTDDRFARYPHLPVLECSGYSEVIETISRRNE